MSAPQETDLAGVNGLMERTEQKSPEFDGESRIGHVCRLLERFGAKSSNKPHSLLVDSVQAFEQFAFGRVVGRDSGGLASPSVAFSKPTRHQTYIPFRPSSHPEEHQPILGHGQMPDLPGEMGRKSRG